VVTGARRATAYAGISVFATTIATVILYFAPAGPPPLENVLTRSLIGLLTFGSLIIFMTGLNELIKDDAVPAHFALSVGQTAGVLFIGIGLIALSNEAGVAFGAPDGSMDPTTDGPLAAANILSHGSIKRLLTAVYLISMSHAVIRSGFLPRWIGALGYAIAAVNIVFIPALFFGTNVTHFYSAHGWGNSALTGSLIIWWIFAVSVALLRSTRDTRGTSGERPGAVPAQRSRKSDTPSRIPLSKS
jgi:hypothetical protein